MDWNVRYTLSRSLTLKLLPTRKLFLEGLDVLKQQELDADAFPVLLGFASGATPQEVFNQLQEAWEIEEDGFTELVGALMAQEHLVPAEITSAQRRETLLRNWPTAGRHYYFRLRDTVRIMSYRAAIEKHVRDKTVVEIGCGMGILSIFAAKAGARRVIAIEEDSVAELAAQMFATNGCATRVELRKTHSRFVELDEQADVIVHEILGVDPFQGNLMPILADARQRLLRPKGRLIPSRLEICCLGIEPEGPPFDEERMLTEAREFPRMYGIDLDPFLRTFADSAQVPTSKRTWVGGRSRFEAKILSEECRLLDLDLQTGPLDLFGWTASLPLRIIHDGVLGGVVMYFRAHLDEQIQLTTSPYAPATSWGWDARTFSQRIRVSAGDEISLTIELKSHAGIQGLRVVLA